MAISQIPYQIYMLLSMMTRRLDDHNFIVWSYQFQILLESQDLFGYVDGNTPCPTKYVITDNEGVTNEISASYKEWNKTDKAILSLLIATLSFDIIDYVVGSKTSREAWSRLSDRYVTISRSHVMQLNTDLYSITKGLDSVEKYLMKVIRLRNQLLALGVGMEDEDIIVVVLNGLPAEYILIKAIIRGRELAVAMQELRILLLSAEQDIANKIVCIRQTFSATKSKAIVSQRCLNRNDNRSKAGKSNTKEHVTLECDSVDMVDGEEQTIVIDQREPNRRNTAASNESDCSGRANIGGLYSKNINDACSSQPAPFSFALADRGSSGSNGSIDSSCDEHNIWLYIGYSDDNSREHSNGHDGPRHSWLDSLSYLS